MIEQFLKKRFFSNRKYRTTDTLINRELSEFNIADGPENA